MLIVYVLRRTTVCINVKALVWEHVCDLFWLIIDVFDLFELFEVVWNSFYLSFLMYTLVHSLTRVWVHGYMCMTSECVASVWWHARAPLSLSLSLSLLHTHTHTHLPSVEPCLIYLVPPPLSSFRATFSHCLADLIPRGRYHTPTTSRGWNARIACSSVCAYSVYVPSYVECAFSVWSALHIVPILC